MAVTVTVGVSVIGVLVGRGWRVAVKVGSSVDVIVGVAVSGMGEFVVVGREVGESNILAVGDGRTRGRMVGIRPIQAAKMPPNAPMIAARIRVLVDVEFFSVI